MSDQTLDRIVRPAEAEEISGFCGVHLRRLEERGEFPRRFKLSATSGPYGATGWLLSDIMTWLEARAASRAKNALRRPDIKVSVRRSGGEGNKPAGWKAQTGRIKQGRHHSKRRRIKRQKTGTP